MTNEEALKKWEETKREYMHTFESEILLAEGAEYFDKCIEALKKRIPEQVYLEGDGEWDGRIVFDTANVAVERSSKKPMMTGSAITALNAVNGSSGLSETR